MLGTDGFALAGSGAIREHGLIDRPTQDIDLLTVQEAQDKFATALGRLSANIRQVAASTEDAIQQVAPNDQRVLAADFPMAVGGYGKTSNQTLNDPHG